MDITSLKRNASAIIDTQMEKNYQVITKVDSEIIIPADYTTKGLAIVSSDVTILGVFATVVGKDYGVSMATSMMSLTPTSIRNELIEGIDHIIFSFDAGSVMIEDTRLVKNKKLVNAVMDYFVDYGNLPWFMSYVDHANLLSQCGYYNDVRLGTSQAILDIITAHITRDPNNFDVYYRHSLKSEADLHKRPTLIPMRDIANNTTSNMARLNGSELKRALRKTLLAEPTRVEPLELLFND